MPWYKVDDGFHSSHKVLSIPRTVRLPAVGLWTLAGAWSADQELDGFVPHFMVTELGGTPRVVTALVKAGLWDESDQGGYQYRNWAEYQPTRAELEATRAREAERKRKQREKQRPQDVPPGHQADSHGDTKRSPNTPSRPVPSRPDPTPKTDSDSGRSVERNVGAGVLDGLNIEAVIRELSHVADIDATEAEASAFAGYVIANARTEVGRPTQYVKSAIANEVETGQWFTRHRKRGNAA